MSFANLPVFIPHVGCPHRCSFCDQNTISGEQRAPTPQEASAQIASALAGLPARFGSAEIAFFGGSFTAVPRAYMVALLEAAQPFLKDGRVRGIRVSTRPDAISPEILETLRAYGVKAIELGAQSMYNKVLEANSRGHTREDVERASRLVRDAGFELGVQMMTGLYGSDAAMDRGTGEALAALFPDTARIYPTAVLQGTRLAELMASGAYAPPALEETVETCAWLLELFESRGVRVIRLGLHDSPELRSRAVGGACHPALGELCRGRVWLHRLERALAGRPPGAVTVRVPARLLSQFVGQGGCNVSALARLGYPARFVPASDLREDFSISGE